MNKNKILKNEAHNMIKEQRNKFLKLINDSFEDCLNNKINSSNRIELRLDIIKKAFILDDLEYKYLIDNKNLLVIREYDNYIVKYNFVLNNDKIYIDQEITLKAPLEYIELKLEV